MTEESAATFTELIQTVQKHPKLFTVGTVAAVYEDTMSVKVTPEDGGEAIDNVPIRVMRRGDRVGFSVVPKVGTEAIVMWLDDHRPTLLQVHEWAKVVVLDKNGLGFKIEDGKVRLGKEKVSTHPLAQADNLLTRLKALEDAYNAHKHKYIPGDKDKTESDATLTQAPQKPDFDSEEVFTS